MGAVYVVGHWNGGRRGGFSSRLAIIILSILTVPRMTYVSSATVVLFYMVLYSFLVDLATCRRSPMTLLEHFCPDKCAQPHKS